MRGIFAAAVLSFAAPAMAAPASAATYVFSSPLAPEVEGATGSGYVTVTFDTTAQTLGIVADWSGLTGTTTVAHIHCCVSSPQVGNVGVAVMAPTLPGFPDGVTSGSYSTLLNLADAANYTASFFTNFGGATIEGTQAALLAGLQSERAYFNIHTTAFPAGEIRGFLSTVPLSAVPEPQTWGMLLLGFGMVGGALRWRRRRALASA